MCLAQRSDPLGRIRAELQRANDVGFEGLVLRQGGRWIKVKPGETHDIAITGPVNGKGAVVGKGGTSSFKVTLKAGSYTFLCTVPGHAAAGMKGTLTVK